MFWEAAYVPSSAAGAVNVLLLQAGFKVGFGSGFGVLFGRSCSTHLGVQPHAQVRVKQTQ